MALSPIIVSVPLYISGIAIERWIDRRRDAGMYRFGDAMSNLSTGLLQVVVAALFATALAAPYHALYDHLRITDWFIAHPTSAWIVAFVGSDFFYYWFHRWSHECALGWFSHVVHHQSEDYNLSVALRQDAWQPFFSLWFQLPLAVLGIDPYTFASAYGFMIVYQYWIHTRFIGTLGPLEWVMNTPSHHRVHHGVDAPYLDKNYAGVFIIWDRLFGTFEPEAQPPTYGTIEALGSYNPIWAHLQYGVKLAEKAAAQRGILGAVSALLRGPGWSADGSLERALQEHLSVRLGEAKYDAPTGTSQKIYAVALFLLAGVASAPVLARSVQFGEGFALVAFAIWSMANLGGVIERRSWFGGSETLRLFFQAGGGVSIAYVTGDPRWLALTAAAAVLGTMTRACAR